MQAVWESGSPLERSLGRAGWGRRWAPGAGERAAETHPPIPRRVLLGLVLTSVCLPTQRTQALQVLPAGASASLLGEWRLPPTWDGAKMVQGPGCQWEGGCDIFQPGRRPYLCTRARHPEFVATSSSPFLSFSWRHPALLLNGVHPGGEGHRRPPC